MNNVEIKFLKVHPDAILPTIAHSDPLTGDSGYDIYCVEDTIVPESEYLNAGDGYHDVSIGNIVVPTGIDVAYITPGYWFAISSKSGLGFKHHLMCHSGIIDNGYKGSLGVKIYNFNHTPYTFNKGDKVAQFVIYPLIHASVSWASEKSQSKRGESGFGSTGQ